MGPIWTPTSGWQITTASTDHAYSRIHRKRNGRLYLFMWLFVLRKHENIFGSFIYQPDMAHPTWLKRGVRLSYMQHDFWCRQGISTHGMDFQNSPTAVPEGINQLYVFQFFSRGILVHLFVYTEYLWTLHCTRIVKPKHNWSVYSASKDHMYTDHICHI